MPDRQVERSLVALIAFHSLCVGVVLWGFPRWAASFGGWGEIDSTFFVRQGGAFHLVVAAGYILEYLRHRSVCLLLLAKGIGTAFLTVAWLSGQSTAWAVPFAALGDGLMLCLAWWISRRAPHIS